MSIVLVVAIDKNNAIGKDNQLIWHLPADLKHFKEITLGHYILMGRKTFESIGKPLPGRTSVVISRQKLSIPGCICVTSVDEALKVIPPGEDAYVIGGGEIFRLTMPLAEKIYLTRVHHQFTADSFFPEISSNEWETLEEKSFEADEKHAYPYSFLTLQKKN